MNAGKVDVIVVGLGGMGSAAAWRLALRGRRVLGLDQHPPGHTLGSSHGLTRIIRQAYYEHPDYVPLARLAYELWYDLEQQTGNHLLTSCPCLSLGPPACQLVEGVRQAARQHRLAVEELGPDELRRRFPMFQPGPHDVGVLEHSAGFLAVDACVTDLQAEARRRGADLHFGERVLAWEPAGDGVKVTTDRAEYHAARLVLSAGPWAASLLGCPAPLRVMRQVPHWLGTSRPERFRRDVFPIFIAETPEGHFYGLPMVDPAGVKVARHYGAEELASPDEVVREVTPADEAAVRAFVGRYLPEVDGPCLRSSVCLYTLTPDRHFLIDLHPAHAGVCLAAGFSGHGFKFAPVVGEILADLVDTGRTGAPIGMFGYARFASPPSWGGVAP